MKNRSKSHDTSLKKEQTNNQHKNDSNHCVYNKNRFCTCKQCSNFNNYCVGKSNCDLFENKENISKQSPKKTIIINLNPYNSKQSIKKLIAQQKLTSKSDAESTKDNNGTQIKKTTSNYNVIISFSKDNQKSTKKNTKKKAKSKKNKKDTKKTNKKKQEQTSSVFDQKTLDKISEALASMNKSYKINYNDFVICSAIFICSNRNHTIIDINASIDIVNISKNMLETITIPAGYCCDCKKYFIMEPTYNTIFKHGIPLCKIVDEKNFQKSTLSDDGWGAKESILKQYDYNVSSAVGLSSTKRQQILSIMVDVGALTKVEIIGYLKYFIHVHRNDQKFDMAISKWKEDIQFISSYKKGNFITYKINSIKRK